MTSYHGIGVMSGSSMDGLDLCYVEFTGDAETDVWGYRIEHAVIVPYSKALHDRLVDAVNMSGFDLITLQSDWSHYVGKCLHSFIENKNLNPDFIASHGHTVFHQPEKSITFQLGDGEIIATYIRCPLVSNFRSKDIAMGGQGAPLIPCGEKFLFQQADLCIGLGGVGNVGCRGGKGFGVCPCNIVLNHLASLHDPDMTFDKDGQLASQGQVIPSVLEELNQLEFYKLTGPKSLSYEWVVSNVFPILKTVQHSIPDLLRTCVEHISDHVTSACVKNISKDHGTVLVTGGGAFNCTLMQTLEEKLAKHNIKMIETEDNLVEYKEAVVIAFLGLRSLLGSENIFSSVTGSTSNSVSGSIHHGSQDSGRPSLTDQFNFMIRKKNKGVNELRIIKEK